MDLKDTVLRALNELVKNGGEGSGDFGHAGNPPHVGGSEPVGSRHARGFKSKSERKEVKKEEKKPTFKPVKGIIQTLKDDYEAGKINAKEVAKELSKANLTPYLLDDSEALEKIGVKQSDSKDKQSDSKEKKEDKKANKLDIKKTTVTTKAGKKREIEYVESVPKGYKKIEGAMTAPLGYTWYSNGKSLLDKERKTILVKDTQVNNSLYKHEYIEY